MIDLHCHSTASDGSLNPDALVELAAASGIKRLALTDHDTVAGLADARAAADRHSITLVPGIEISARYETMTVHILGLGIDPEHPALGNALSLAREQREQRARRIAAGLEKVGIDEAWQRTLDIAEGGILGRAHFARMLVETGHAKDFRQVFRRYMVSGRPGYVPSEWMPINEAVELIACTGGASVLAHPAAYGLTTRKQNRLVESFADCGGHGLEVISGPTDADEIQRLGRVAATHGLLASQGSDFHGPDKPGRSFGTGPTLPADCPALWDHFTLW